MVGVTDKQLSVFRWIQKFIAQNGYPPAIREIGKALEIKSPSHVLYILRRLEVKGLIFREASVARGIRVINPHPQPLSLKVERGVSLQEANDGDHDSCAEVAFVHVDGG